MLQACFVLQVAGELQYHLLELREGGGMVSGPPRGHLQWLGVSSLRMEYLAYQSEFAGAEHGRLVL